MTLSSQSNLMAFADYMYWLTLVSTNNNSMYLKHNLYKKIFIRISHLKARFAENHKEVVAQQNTPSGNNKLVLSYSNKLDKQRIHK